MIRHATPRAFQPEISESHVDVLPLVRDTNRPWDDWRAGWCTYTDGFHENPDVEVMCGGLNTKSPTAAAVWRQGHLLHFGFQQSPAEMNEAGQRLLLNAIDYISRFTEDRPIAVTPSVFAGPVARPRTYLDRRLKQDGDVDGIPRFVSGKTFERLKDLDLTEARQWYEEHRAYLHPGPDQKLEVDQQALALKAPLDDLRFFEKTIEALGSQDPKQAHLAESVLRRYAPAETEHLETLADWNEWFEENREYLFFSDQGDYRWYIDPLAQKREVPSDELRGPRRASGKKIK